mmetsp:Transcript_128604/g.181433  ORF Transcript_128604/g.181433 Transcript_128604/m.181433 type:complete len:97 (+) Transcript_128604:55-345(+)
MEPDAGIDAPVDERPPAKCCGRTECCGKPVKRCDPKKLNPIGKDAQGRCTFIARRPSEWGWVLLAFLILYICLAALFIIQLQIYLATTQYPQWAPY